MSTTARTNRARMTARMERREVERKSQMPHMADRLLDKYTQTARELGYPVQREFWDTTREKQAEWIEAFRREELNKRVLARWMEEER